MKLAFSIAVHKSPGQVLALARAICRNGHYCVIHCNQRSGPAFREAIATGVAREQLANVVFLDSEPVSWGNSSILRVELRAIQALLDWADDWSHHVNLSGQCLPTKPLDEIEAFLTENHDKSFIELIDLPTERPDLAYRFSTYYVEVAGKPRNTRIPRPQPRGFELCFGAFWCILNRAACEHIVRSPEARRILQYLRYTMFPDELAFQSILLNSPLRSSLVASPKRLMLWRGPSPTPLVLTMDHWDRITDPDILFARKFDPDVDSEVITRLAERIGCDLSIKSPLHA
ncbi:MAG: beta-1,6-N-acetylglucosaminyltransferase [Hyphomicrobiaceae bacterium]